MAYNPANPFAYLMSGAERTFNHLPNQQYAAFNYLYNPYADNGHGITGQHQLFTSNDQGALRVDIGTGIQLSASITGVTVNIPPSTAVTGVVNVTGQIAITNPLLAVSGAVQATVVNALAITGSVATNLAAVTGQLAAISAQMAVLTGATSWQKVASSGYVGAFSPLASAALVNKINGISKAGATSSFVLVYDGATGAGAFPVASVTTQPGNNWFIDLAEAGVQFNSSLVIVNSTDAINPVASGPADFFASVIYRT